MATGEIEVIPKDLKILNFCHHNTPFPIQEAHKVVHILHEGFVNCVFYVYMYQQLFCLVVILVFLMLRLGIIGPVTRYV